MPSSSTHATETEQLLQEYHRAVVAHLTYPLTTTDIVLPPRLDANIRALFATILDRPPPPPPSSSSSSSRGSNRDGDRHHGGGDDNDDLDLENAVLEMAAHRPAPSALLFSLATWLERTAGLLARKGRGAEAEWCKALAADTEREGEVAVMVTMEEEEGGGGDSGGGDGRGGEEEEEEEEEGEGRGGGQEGCRAGLFELGGVKPGEWWPGRFNGWGKQSVRMDMNGH